MKNFSIYFDRDRLKLPDNEKEMLAKFGFQAFFEPIFNHALQIKYPQGVPFRQGKILSRIQAKLDAIEPGFSTLTLEEAEFDLIKEVFTSESAAFPPQQYRIVSIYVSNIENAEDVKETKKVEK